MKTKNSTVNNNNSDSKVYVYILHTSGYKSEYELCRINIYRVEKKYWSLNEFLGYNV